MANNKNKQTNKSKAKPKTKLEVLETAMDEVQDVKKQAQAEYDAAVASLVIVRN